MEVEQVSNLSGPWKLNTLVSQGTMEVNLIIYLRLGKQFYTVRHVLATVYVF